MNATKTKYNWTGLEYAAKCLVPNLPVEKLKGNGRQRRVRLSNIVANGVCARLESLLPKTHIAHVCIARGKGYSSTVTFVSVRTAELLKEFSE